MSGEQEEDREQLTERQSLILGLVAALVVVACLAWSAMENDRIRAEIESGERPMLVERNGRVMEAGGGIAS